MSTVNVIIIGAVALVALAIGVWFTISEFSSGHVEENSTERREKLEDDTEIDHKKEDKT